jgi:hypothetical protein
MSKAHPFFDLKITTLIFTIRGRLTFPDADRRAEWRKWASRPFFIRSSTESGLAGSAATSV